MKIMNLPQNKRINIAYLALISLIISCEPAATVQKITVEVENNLDFPRNEVVAVAPSDLASILENSDEDHIRIKKEGSNEYLRTQWIDYDQNGKNDELLFQAKVDPNAIAQFQIVVDSIKMAPESDVIAYSRLVPERTDDYTWENDKVAFRTYGPTGEREALEGVPGSTLSSGIDLWLKRTDKAIINKWYKAHLAEPGSYHKDHGEGYDPYHVGSSRGTGGVGVWQDDVLLVSNNFTESRTLAAGPLRTVFELDYAPWSEFGISETKRITLDLGSNFSKYEIDFSPEKAVPNYTIGITLHKNEGDAKINEEQGWFRHWEAIDGVNVGEGIVIDPKVVQEAIVHTSEVADQSSVLVITKPQEKLTYYAGFAWVKSGQVSSVEDWETMLQQQAQILSSPLTVTIKQ